MSARSAGYAGPFTDVAVAGLVGLAVLLATVDALLSCAASISCGLAGGGWSWHEVGLRLPPSPAEGGAFVMVTPPVGHRVVFWAVFTALVVAVVTAGAAGVAAWRRCARPEEGARWATRRGERVMRVPASAVRRPHRLVAGRSRLTGSYLAGEDCISAIAIGPNGSGKTTSLIIPNAMEWAGPVVMTTTKPQDLAEVITVRGRVGPVFVFAPAGLADGAWTTAPIAPPPGPRSTTRSTPPRPTGWRSGCARPPAWAATTALARGCCRHAS